ncbi:PAS domain-containing protein [Methylosinus sp. PW1]|uniref:PAS domain-containing protein n=1 Tax=Methylosinus sp. PW1 TaxID=107636 RepID=UPI0018DC3CD1|nr:PAS domain-containing protein [Methylosinus sp. PW1]
MATQFSALIGGLAAAMAVAAALAALALLGRLRSRSESNADFNAGDACARVLWENGPVGAFCWEEGGEVTEANDEFLRMTGYERADLAAGRIDWRAATRLLSPAENSVETEFVRKDGARARLRIRFVALDERRGRGVGFAQDAAEAQELRRQAERLRRLELRAIGFAHDINQPLTAAAAYLQAARRRATLGGGAQSEEQLAAMDRAGAQLYRAARLVGDWRELFTHESCAPTEIALHPLIREAWETMRGDLGDRVSAELRLRAERDLVIGDRAQIEEEVSDLLRAAAQAAIAASRRELIIVTSARDGEIAIEISDAGAASIAPCGDPRAAAEPARSGALVEADGARFSSQKAHGGGSAFRLALPLADTACG